VQKYPEPQKLTGRFIALEDMEINVSYIVQDMI